MRKRVMAGLTLGLMALTACGETMVTEGGLAASALSVSRLTALGFRPAAVDASGVPVAMSYSGPPKGAVLCGAGSFAPVEATVTDLDGVGKRATLDAYMILSGGKVTSGLYALTLSGANGVEGIDFHPGEVARFASGLACKAA